MEPVQKESWKEELQEIERTELLPEHQKMQKKSQKLQSLQDKKKYLKDAGDWEEETRMLHEENEESQARFKARFQTLSENSRNCRKESDILESRPCKQERKEEAAVCHSPTDVASIQQLWSSSSRWEQQRLCNSSP